MTDDTLDAQARELTAACMAHGSSGGVACVACITSWARRLVADSRAGALRAVDLDSIGAKLHRECIDREARYRGSWYDARPWSEITEDHRDNHREAARRIKDILAALAAEAEPGAQDRAGKGA